MYTSNHLIFKKILKYSFIFVKDLNQILLMQRHKLKIYHNQILIGKHLKEVVEIKGVKMERILNFFHLTDEDEIMVMYEAKSLDTEVLLKWCKLLEYNFFLLYHNHLLLFSSAASNARLKPKQINSQTKHLHLKKNIYTKEIKDFIIHLVVTEQMTKKRSDGEV